MWAGFFLVPYNQCELQKSHQKSGRIRKDIKLGLN